MEKIFVDQIKNGDRIESIFLVKEKDSGVTRSGNLYLHLILMDRTGEIKARIWDNAEKITREFKKNDFVKIKSRASLYQKMLQLTINDIKYIPPDEVFIDDFLPKTKSNIEKLFNELKEFVKGMNNIHLKKLLELFLQDKECMRLFKMAPAAKALHHACIGGLLEHTLNLLKLVIEVSKIYPRLDIDLLISGAVLHDIGKIKELSFQNAFDYTDEGRLVGHITIGVEMLKEKIREIPDFPFELELLLEHLILSHHGHFEFGSPKRPKTLEAITLYYLDDLDAKIDGIAHIMDVEKGDISPWTSFNKLYDRYFFKGKQIDIDELNLKMQKNEAGWE
ncbi:MAG: HD domain-containing protein [Thermodesulfobacteriota bacterium]|nr:HD domain-containing protein [Thermodesulfobacteriota bacterium]